MFFCNPCAEKNNWPTSMFKSRGNCEVCGRVRVCNEVKSSLLPPLEKSKDERKEKK